MGADRAEPEFHTTTTIQTEANFLFPETDKNRESSGAVPLPRNRDINNKASKQSSEASFRAPNPQYKAILGFCSSRFQIGIQHPPLPETHLHLLLSNQPLQQRSSSTQLLLFSGRTGDGAQSSTSRD